MAPRKATTTTRKAAAPAKTANKRKRAADDEPTPPTKLLKTPQGPVINHAPTERLNVYVCGEGANAELGLGTAKGTTNVKRPRLNPNLAQDKVGVVKLTSGGMHNIALTHDNKILTWGVNDQGALGRDTTWDGGLKDMDAPEDSDSDSDDEDNGLNPKESVPGEVDFSKADLPPNTTFTDVAAGDSCSFALADDGHVYGWGVFRNNEGVYGFLERGEVVRRPVLIPGLKNITSIKCGANHALALTNTGAVYSWGNGQQNQLGRRVIERTKASGLTPREFGLPKGKKAIASIHTGNDHSFAISKTGDVYAWGLNNFGETGIMDNAGSDSSTIVNPRIVTALKGKNVTCLGGGTHHSIAATAEGDCLVWGRLDGSQMGISPADLDKLPADAIVKDEHNRPRIVAIPQKVTAIEGQVTQVTAASEHNLAITKDGKAWSWGYSGCYQTGQGTEDDVEVATMIDNTAVREKKLLAAQTGGQFSVLVGV